jgi:peptidoglycan-associated lipoprotein
MDDMFRTSVQPIYFDFDRAEIRPDQVARLQASARFLQQNATVQFAINGHADERGSQEYNIGLGDRRANAVRQFLVTQGVAASRIQTVSYGEERPACTQSNETCWSQNRRADFALR